MPLLSMFYGIILRMYNNNEHNTPHFHAYYCDYEAIFSFEIDDAGAGCSGLCVISHELIYLLKYRNIIYKAVEM